MEWGNKVAIHLGWLLTISAVATSGRAEREFVAHTAEAYGTSGMCSGDTLNNANEDALYFDNGLTGYDQLVHWTDAFYDARDFIDPVFSIGMDDVDPSGSDFADVIFVSGHGGGSCASGNERIWLTPGDNADMCTFYLAHQVVSSRHVRLGGTTAGSEADAFVAYTCNSTQRCAFLAGSFDTLSVSGGQFNILNGFHGDVAEVSGYQSDLSSYSTSVLYNYVGDAWLDWMYAYIGSGAYNCPSSITWGTNTTKTTEVFEQHGWYDFPGSGTRATSTFWRLCGCDPVDGDALPSC